MIESVRVDPPATRYARSGEISIAYQVVGEKGFDLIWVPCWISNVEESWEVPEYAHFLHRLASFSRLILFDKRGTGLSDRVSNDRVPTLEQRMDDLRAVLLQEFLTGVRRGPDPDRVLATVLFTDIAGSTERAAKLGDRRWRELLAAHHAVVRDQLDRWQGREIGTTGDGFLASFDGPARAIRCACAIRDQVRMLGLEIRAGLHTGECERLGAKLAGLAVHTGARVAAVAAPSEVLVSQTVKDLVAGSGIEFDARGLHLLKGVPGEWLLYSVARW